MRTRFLVTDHANPAVLDHQTTDIRITEQMFRLHD